MRLNDIVRKISRYNRRKYLLFCLSITFSVSMVGAFGILLFSATVTDVLSVLGSTYVIATALYGLTVIGLVIFAVYANNVYIKYKMDEIGVFMSIGLKPSDVRKMMNKEFISLYSLSAALGLLLALPISFLSWSFLTLFLSTAETAFTIGWTGYGVALIFAITVCGVLLIKNTKAIVKIDIIQILKLTTSNETVTGRGFMPGLIGLACIPVGVALFWILDKAGNLTNNFSSFSGFGLILSAVGLYLFIAYITSVGEFFKRNNKPYYLKNILFFNLVKQKGKQYTLSLFISTLLIAAAIFALCFNATAMVSSYYLIANDTFDYSLLVPETQELSLNLDVLQNIADNNDMEFAPISDLQLLHVGRQHTYGQNITEWSTDFCISETAFNELASDNLSVESGSFVYFSIDDRDASLNTFSKLENNLYLPSTREFVQMALQDTISSSKIINSSVSITELIILNDNDFESFSGKLDAEYRYTYYLWNADKTGDTSGFFDDMLSVVIDVNGGQYVEDMRYRPVRELMRQQDGKDIPHEEIYIPYLGNELSAARNWMLYPFSKATSSKEIFEIGAVYLLLMLFITVIGFVSATMIIGLRVVSTIWQDEASYKKAVMLGITPHGLKRLITKQMSLVFFFPSVVGSMIAILVLNRMVDVTTASQHSGLITLIAVLLSLIAIIMEVCVFFLLRKKVTG